MCNGPISLLLIAYDSERGNYCVSLVFLGVFWLKNVLKHKLKYFSSRNETNATSTSVFYFDSFKNLLC